MSYDYLLELLSSFPIPIEKDSMQKLEDLQYLAPSKDILIPTILSLNKDGFFNLKLCNTIFYVIVI